jgi:acetoin utilization deacetylase AcuC-like enzyme
MTLALISHPDCLRHEMGGWHPEQPARITAIQDQLVASGLDVVLRHYDAPLASREQLVRVHSAGYVDFIFGTSPEQGLVQLDPDTAMNPHTLAAALRAAGAVVYATDLVLGNEVGCAFCNVRPPGHHAERGRAMGFCIFNNVAVGVAHALEHHRLQRVAIADFDVHHGNGTEDIFRDEPRVMLCSSFQHPYYPFQGADTRSTHIVNVPLAAGTAGSGFRAEVERHWVPALEEFRPELVFVSAGFDAHREDDMSEIDLTERDYVWVTQQIKHIADRYASGRIVSTLEGGYALHALGRSVAAHLKALIGHH